VISTPCIFMLAMPLIKSGNILDSFAASLMTTARGETS